MSKAHSLEFDALVKDCSRHLSKLTSAWDGLNRATQWSSIDHNLDAHLHRVMEEIRYAHALLMELMTTSADDARMRYCQDKAYRKRIRKAADWLEHITL